MSKAPSLLRKEAGEIPDRLPTGEGRALIKEIGLLFRTAYLNHRSVVEIEMQAIM